MHSSCVDTLSSARLPLVKSPLEVGFRNIVENLCRRRMNRLDGRTDVLSAPFSFAEKKKS